ncbi:MAG TPA: CDP-diacylglycerol--serine O-phosphatidyltransferase [Bryobacteraceae bacterium]|jgi:CDP-diacylglycerol--serine O-phosphatidyltransferase
MNIRDRLVDPKSPDRRPRRAAYALPTFFTAGNIFLGFYSIVQSFQGAMAYSGGNLHAALDHFSEAAQMIGWAIVADGLDGRIARMTNTTSEFGKEMDSLADVITFGFAPAVLAFAWGVQFTGDPPVGFMRDHLHRLGYFVAFMFLLCGSLRLARFNVQKNPVPSNPGRPDRKYFVGMPIPAGAGLVASIIYLLGGQPLQWWVASVVWLGLLGLTAFLMVSTWRYPSFKDMSLLRPRSTIFLLGAGGFIYLLWNFPQPVLFLMMTSYALSGILIRLFGTIRRRVRRRGAAHPTQPEHQIG